MTERESEKPMMHFFSVFTCSRKHYSVSIACQYTLETACLVSVCWIWACICRLQYIRIQRNHAFSGVMHVIIMQWWSLETWFRDPLLRVSVSKVSGLVSVSKAAGLETLNIAKK